MSTRLARRPAAAASASARGSTPSGREGATAPWWRRPPSPTVASVAVFVLAILAFANTFGHGFVWDDTVLLDQKARFYRSWVDAWREPPGLPNMRMYRPLEMMSLWIDQRLWSSGTGFHVTQVLLHAVTGVLVLRLLLALGAWPSAALVGAAVFVVHPVQVESVAWLTCRADVLTGTFATAAMLLFVRHQDAPRWWTVGALVPVAFLATAAKETGSVTPFLLLAAALVLPRPATGVRARLRRAAPALAAATAGVIACQLLRPAEVTTGIGREALGLADLRGLLGAFGYQLTRVLAPVGFAPYVPQTPIDAPHLFFAAAGAVGLAVAFATWRRAVGDVGRLGILWFVIAVAPAVAVVLADFSATPVAERRLYLGMVGVALVVTATLGGARRLAASTAGTVAVLAVLTLMLGVTVRRNALWKDELTLWTAVTERKTDEPLPFLNLGLALASAGRATEAETAYRRALALQPSDVTRQRLGINLGLLLVDRGALDEAEELFSTANAIGGHAIAHRGLALVARKRAQSALRAGDVTTANAELTKALAAVKQALAINPRYYQAHATLAGISYDAGHYRDAAASYRRAADLAGTTPDGRQAAAAAAELDAWLAAHPDAQ